CSAASRAYIPASLWEEVKNHVIEDVKSFKMGSPEDMSNFISAVITESSVDKLAKAIDDAKASNEAEIVVGGGYDKSNGSFIEPTVIVTTKPKYDTMEREWFGPVLTVYVYEDVKWEESLQLVDQTSEYALTGSISSGCRYAIETGTKS